MNSYTTPEFWTACAALPPPVKQAAREKCRLQPKDPPRSSVCLDPKAHHCSVRRVTRGYRALAIRVPEGFLWFWIGKHDEYERLIS